MMTEFIIGVGSALWLGILTSISPCPLATNIAAISYIGRKVGNSRQVFLTGLLYTIGRTLAYLGLAFVLVASVLSVPQISLFLQKYMHLVLGPILIVVGMFLLGLIQLSMGGGGMSEGLQKRVDAMGIWGALLLGVVFALTFCPTSAALFFGSLVPLSLKVNSSVTLAGGLRRGNRAAGHGLRGAAGHQRSVGRQSLQRAGEDRVVGADAHRLDFHAGGHLLLAEVRVPGDLSFPAYGCSCGRRKSMIRASMPSLLAALLLAVPCSAQEWADKMFAARSHDFGSIARGAKAEFAFELTNLYLEDVHIASVRASCGCTTPRIEKDTLKTYEKGAVIAHINSDRFLGNQGATITVTIDKPQYAAKSSCTSRSTSSATCCLSRPASRWERRRRGIPSSGRSASSTPAGSDWQILEVRSGNPHLTGTVTENGAPRRPDHV